MTWEQIALVTLSVLLAVAVGLAVYLWRRIRGLVTLREKIEKEHMDRERHWASEQSRTEESTRVLTLAGDALRTSQAARLADAEQRNTNLREESRVTVARLEGQIQEGRERSTRYDQLMQEHEWHIGGRVAAHGQQPRIQYDCAHCPAVIVVPEGFLKEEGLRA